jgi:hypothetical protein
MVLMVQPLALADTLSAPFHVEGGRIVDSTGRTAILRGINAMDKTLGADGDYDPDLSDADIDRVAAMGFNVLRLGTTWAAIESSPTVYNDAFIARLFSLMDRLYSQGIYAIVDMHQDVWGESLGGDGAPAWAAPQCNAPPDVPLAETTGQFFVDYVAPGTQAAFTNFWVDGSPDLYCTGPVQTRFIDMWSHLASKLAGHPALVGYDLFNEPWYGAAPPGAFEITQLYPFYKRLTAAIRAVDDSSIIFFEPPLPKSFQVPAVPAGPPDANAVYAPHLYGNTNSSSDDAFAGRDQSEADFMGVPMWFGEWGNFENGGGTQATRFYDSLDRLQLGSAYWVYTQGFADGLKAQPASADVPHRRVFPEAFLGTASWSFDANSQSFAMQIEVGDSPPPVKLVVPQLLYPSGLEVQGDGTVSFPSSNRAEWTLPGAGVFNIEIRPIVVSPPPTGEHPNPHCRDRTQGGSEVVPGTGIYARLDTYTGSFAVGARGEEGYGGVHGGPDEGVYSGGKADNGWAYIGVTQDGKLDFAQC